MMRYGFIRTKDEIKFLLLICISYLPFPVTYDSIVDICTWCDEGFGYFELSDAFSELCDSGHIECTESTSKEMFQITDKGRETANVFSSRLPYTVREAAEVSALRVIRKIRRDAQILTSTKKVGEKEYTVNLTMEGVFSVQMNVVSESQASLLEHNFKKRAESVYQDLLSSLTQNDEAEE